ncbi:MAG: bifunctional riboflavin kinase/FAD synthetase [Flavobacteriales bacterium]|nr:bifunctional riboflavin kinase/FAD synthetase [Flavobacteriales bacterium]
MQVHTDLSTFVNVERPVLTTGTFDGVHLGHQTILHRLKETARKEEGHSVLFTFYPHPRMVLFPNDNDLKLLSTQREKVEQLEAAGLDHLLVIPFSRTFSRLHALDFVRDVLVDTIRIHAMVIGYDHRFGRNREGDINLLRQLSDAYSFHVEEIPAQEIDHVKVSSTKVREALLKGDVHLANDLLGYSYSIGGVVVKGDQRGRTIGFPTANVGAVDHFKLIPADGVYAVNATLKEGGLLKGMMNVGVRPTIEGSGERSLEVHLFDFDRDIYGEPITVRVRHRLRDEVRFDGLDALKTQLHKDREHALRLLS